MTAPATATLLAAVPPGEDDCGRFDVSCRTTEAAAAWFQEQMTEMVKSMLEATVNLSASIASAWVHIPLMPSLGEWVGGGDCHIDPSGRTVCTPPQWQESELLIWFGQSRILGWWVGAFMVLGVIMAGLRIMWRQDGADAREVIKGFLIFAAISGAGTATVQLLLGAGERFSSYLLQQSVSVPGDEDQEAVFGAGLADILFLPADLSGPEVEGSFWLAGTGVGAIMAILLLLFAVMVFVVQIVILVIRGALLLIMVILLPVAAALAMTDTGRRMLSKYAGWLLALILYKPAAAILYAIAFRLGSDEQSLLNVVTGMAIFVCALFMLPALLRLIVPATAAVASGGGTGGIAAAGAGAVGATGAIAVKSALGGGAGAAAGAAQAVGRGASSAGGSAAAGASGSGGPGGGPGGSGGGVPAGGAPSGGASAAVAQGAGLESPSGSGDVPPAGDMAAASGSGTGAPAAARPNGAGDVAPTGASAPGGGAAAGRSVTPAPTAAGGGRGAGSRPDGAGSTSRPAPRGAAGGPSGAVGGTDSGPSGAQHGAAGGPPSGSVPRGGGAVETRPAGPSGAGGGPQGATDGPAPRAGAGAAPPTGGPPAGATAGRESEGSGSSAGPSGATISRATEGAARARQFGAAAQDATLGEDQEETK